MIFEINGLDLPYLPSFVKIQDHDFFNCSEKHPTNHVPPRPCAHTEHDEYSSLVFCCNFEVKANPQNPKESVSYRRKREVVIEGVFGQILEILVNMFVNVPKPGTFTNMS